MPRARGGRGCDRVSSRVRGDLKLEAHERREARQARPAHDPIRRSHGEFMFQSLWISRYVCKLLDGRGGESESHDPNLATSFPVAFPRNSVAHVRASGNARTAVLGCIPLRLYLSLKALSLKPTRCARARHGSPTSNASWSPVGLF